MDKLYTLREMLLGIITNEFEKGIHNIDTKEMGEVIDMLYDIEKCIDLHHNTVAKTM